MSKESNKIDDLYKSEMFDAELLMDTTDMWADLENKLDQKKKKRRMFILFWGIGLAVTALISFLLLTNLNEFKKINGSNSAFVNQENTFLNLTNEEQIPSSKSQINNINHSKIDKSDKITGSIKSFENDNKTSLEHNKSIASNNLSKKHSNRNHIIKNSINTSPEKESQKSSSSKTVGSNDNEKQVKDQTIIKEDVVLFEPRNTLKKLINIKPLSINIEGKSEYKIQKEFIFLDEKKLDNPISFGYQLASYYPLRASVEPYSSIIFSYGQQLNVHYKFTKSWSLGVGIEKLDIYEKFRWVKEFSVITPTYRDTAFYYENNGLIEYYGDSILVNRNTIKTRQKRNQHTLWSIPIGFTYMEDFGKWRFGIIAQAVFNFRHNFKGLVALDEDAIPYESSIIKYRSQLGLMYNVAPQISHKINSQISISLSIPIRFTTKSWFTSPDVSYKRWNACGLQLGVKYGL